MSKGQATVKSLGKIPETATHTPSFNQNLVAWPHLAAREAGKSCLYSAQL